MSNARNTKQPSPAASRQPPRQPAAGVSGPAPKPSAASYGVQPGPPEARVRTEAIVPEVRERPAGETRQMARPRPADELVKRRQMRLQRGVTDHGHDKRLGINEARLDTDNFEYYWASAREVSRLEGREWEVVPAEELKGEEVTRHAGYDEQSKPTQHVLMRKYKPWDIEDRARRIALNKEQDQALLRGRADVLTDGGGGIDYVPKNNSVSTEDAFIPQDSNQQDLG